MTTRRKPTINSPPDRMVEYADAMANIGDDLIFTQKAAYYAEANYWLLRAIYTKIDPDEKVTK